MSRPLRLARLRWAALAGLCLSAPAMAATYSWDHNGDGTESNGSGTWDLTTARWVSSDNPGVATVWDNAGLHDARFPGDAEQTITVDVDIVAKSIAGTTTSPKVTFNGSGTITFDGSAATQVNHNRGVMTFNVPIGGDDGLVIGGHALGSTVLNTANPYSGLTVLSAGTLRITNSGALGVVPENGTAYDHRTRITTSVLELDGSGGSLTIDEYIQLDSTAATLRNVAGNNIVANNVEVTGVSTLRRFDVATGTTLEVQGVVTGSGGFEKLGGGTPLLPPAPDASLATGLLRVSEGKIVINRTISSTGYINTALVQTGGILAGSGTLVGSSAWHSSGVWGITDGAIAPGDLGLAGTLTLDNYRVTFADSSVLYFDLSGDPNSSDNDLLQIGASGSGPGHLTLDGTVVINALEPLADGGVYTLISYGRGGGVLTDNGLVVDVLNSTPGYEYEIKIDETSKTVNLLVTVVPEPGSLSLLAIGALGMMRRRR